MAVLSLVLGTAPLAAEAARVDARASGPIYEAIALDAETGQVLRELNPDAVTYPASLTKMMTLYLTFEALSQGRLKLDQYLPVSAAAAAHAPSRLGLQPGEGVMVRDLILAIVTKSANDAAAVLAEGLGGGSETAFAVMMTQKAQQLGMAHTHYANASGLPDPEQLTTARDIARLALALYHDFPREYRYFSVKQFDFEGAIVNGHDHMLDWYPGADGIKTGFTVASGYNLATSAVQNGRRLIGVILGGRSVRARDESMAQLLDLGFGDLARQQPVMVAQHSQATMVAAVTAPAATPAVGTQETPDARPAFATVAAASMATPSTTPSATTPSATTPSSTTLSGAPDPAAAPQIAAAAPAIISDQPAAHATTTPPASSAVAAAVSRTPEREPGESWAIQLGAFRGEAAAERVEQAVARMTLARGKQPQILAPAGGERLYRARLLYFSAGAARSACGELHRQHIDCSVVPATGVKVASR
ncbi:MAG TPA: D-alanyl-D-alanine carboxypeptidase [Stellaceae bacterium]|nr:D-alanyl-D-alanine carboxypeptidase [Stellaceae bacterium]